MTRIPSFTFLKLSILGMQYGISVFVAVFVQHFSKKKSVRARGGPETIYLGYEIFLHLRHLFDNKNTGVKIFTHVNDIIGIAKDFRSTKMF